MLTNDAPETGAMVPVNPAVSADWCRAAGAALSLAESASHATIVDGLPETPDSTWRRGTDVARLSPTPWNVPTSVGAAGNLVLVLRRTRPRKTILGRSVARRADDVRTKAKEVSTQPGHRESFWSNNTTPQFKARSVQGIG